MPRIARTYGITPEALELMSVEEIAAFLMDLYRERTAPR